MNVLKKKLKKVHGAKKFFYYFSSILYLVSLIYFVYGLLHLKGIETVIRIVAIIFFAIWFFIYTLGGLISLLSKKNKTFIALTIITLLWCPIFIVPSFYINKFYGSLSTMNKDTITYTSNLIALKETNFDSDSTIGMIEAENDIEGNVLAKKLIEKESLTNNIETYEDYHSMISDLYEGKIDACFVSANYAIVFENESFTEEEEANGTTGSLAEKVKVLYEYSEDRENVDTETLSASKTKTLTEPFSLLIMGVDSTENGMKANQAFNGDTLILLTFNPKTLTATMVSLPRDLYVPIACNHNRYAKINSAAAYGSSCVINTVQQLTDIDIDYYVKMNFQGVVDLVEALGGVEVDVEEPDFSYDESTQGLVCEQDSQRRFGNNLVCIKPGLQTLNGEQALAYARCRHLYAMSDIARNQHQQAIIEAMAQKLKTIRSINDFENILNSVSNNIETNMTPDQILSFYSVGKDALLSSNSSALSIKKTYIAYYNLTVWRGYNASSLGYYQQSMDAITKLMKVNLDLEKEKPTKTFSISYNEDYETPLVGYGLTGGEKLITLPNFIGFDKDYVNEWCTTNNVNCLFESRVDSNEAGFILEQSAHENELVKSLSSVTFYYSDGSTAPTTTPEDDDTEDTEDDDTKNEDDEKENSDETENNKDSNENDDNNNNNTDNNNSGSNSEENNNTNDESTSGTTTDPSTTIVPSIPSNAIEGTLNSSSTDS